MGLVQVCSCFHDRGLPSIAFSYKSQSAGSEGDPALRASTAISHWEQIAGYAMSDTQSSLSPDEANRVSLSYSSFVCDRQTQPCPVTPPSSSSGRTVKRRTKTGCRECRRKRVKCDEGGKLLAHDGRRLACKRCVRRRTPCQYPWVGGAELESDESHWAPPAAQRIQTSVALPSFAHNSGHHAIVSQDNVNLVSGTDNSHDASWITRTACSVAKSPGKPGPATLPSSPAYLPSEIDDAERSLLAYLFSGRIRSIGVFDLSNPTLDHFQTQMLPYLAHTLPQICRTRGADEHLLYHAALRLSAAHRDWVDRASRASPSSAITNFSSSTPHAIAGYTTLATIRDDRRTERTLIGHALLILGSFFEKDAPSWQVAPKQLEVDLSSPLGHHVYDVMCVYHAQDCLATGSEPDVTIPRAGSRDVETTFGISRSMWVLTSKVATLLSQARILQELTGDADAGALAASAAQLLRQLEDAVHTVWNSNRESRVRLGTQVRRQAVPKSVRVPTKSSSHERTSPLARFIAPANCPRDLAALRSAQAVTNGPRGIMVVRTSQNTLRANCAGGKRGRMRPATNREDVFEKFPGCLSWLAVD